MTTHNDDRFAVRHALRDLTAELHQLERASKAFDVRAQQTKDQDRRALPLSSTGAGPRRGRECVAPALARRVAAGRARGRGPERDRGADRRCAHDPRRPPDHRHRRPCATSSRPLSWTATAMPLPPISARGRGSATKATRGTGPSDEQFFAGAHLTLGGLDLQSSAQLSQLTYTTLRGGPRPADLGQPRRSGDALLPRARVGDRPQRVPRPADAVADRVQRRLTGHHRRAARPIAARAASIE